LLAQFPLPLLILDFGFLFVGGSSCQIPGRLLVWFIYSSTVPCSGLQFAFWLARCCIRPSLPVRQVFDSSAFLLLALCCRPASCPAPEPVHFLVSQILLPALPFGTPVSWWFCAPVLSLLSFCLLHAHSDSLNLNPFFFASLVLQDICCFRFWLHSLGLWLHSLIFVCNL
jgi:hypothetical protein